MIYQKDEFLLRSINNNSILNLYNHSNYSSYIINHCKDNLENDIHVAISGF